MMFGRHQLIKLSPKKTVEGFVGAFFVTIAFAFIVRAVHASLARFICLQADIPPSTLSGPLSSCVTTT